MKNLCANSTFKKTGFVLEKKLTHSFWPVGGMIFISNDVNFIDDLSFEFFHFSYQRIEWVLFYLSLQSIEVQKMLVED